MLEKMNAKEYWDSIYDSKATHQLSWFQVLPKTSLDFIHSFNLPKTAKIIDVGGGDSKLVDILLDEGFENITILDVSGSAISKCRERLGARANRVKWIEKDVCDFKPDSCYDLWHDRATFHFLTGKTQIEYYMKLAKESVSGYIIVGTFSNNGPLKCSGLEVKQYSQDQLTERFQNNGFEKFKCVTEDHKTPFGTMQNFTFCSFNKIHAL